MKKRLLFLTGEGLGNVIQTLPAIRTLTEVLGYDVDLCHLFGSYSLKSLDWPYVTNFYTGNELKSIDVSEYIGKVATAWVSNYVNVSDFYKLPLMTAIYPIRMDVSEVETYMMIAQSLGGLNYIPLWKVHTRATTETPVYDVIISNGYNRFGSADWSVKAYQYYREFAKLCTDYGFTVASVGTHDNEYVEGTIKEFDHSLDYVASLIANAGCLVSNDTGLYHLANIVGTKNFPIFTATSRVKNYDKRFHIHATPIYREDLTCSPCQDKRLWKSTCKEWRCREIAPEYIFTVVKEYLNG